MDADQIVAGTGEAVQVAAGRPDQRAIAKRRAVGERDAVRLGIDGDDSPVEQQIDIPLAQKVAGRVRIRSKLFSPDRYSLASGGRS